jgi:hypothetical protein
MHGHILWALSRTNKWRTTSEVISRFDPNTASSWRKTRTSRGARLSSGWTPSSLVLSYFTELLHLVILLQIDPVFDDKPKTVCEGCYEIENTFIFTWSLVPGVRHYYWLRGLIRQLPPNNKANYLVRIIRRILDFLQL